MLKINFYDAIYTNTHHFITFRIDVPNGRNERRLQMCLEHRVSKFRIHRKHVMNCRTHNKPQEKERGKGKGRKTFSPHTKILFIFPLSHTHGVNL